MAKMTYNFITGLVISKLLKEKSEKILSLAKFDQFPKTSGTSLNPPHCSPVVKFALACNEAFILITVEAISFCFGSLF